MGDRYLYDLADVCRRTGYPVEEVAGWEERARGSGGYYNLSLPSHVIAHHTASGPGSDGWPDVDYCTFGHENAPLCNLYLARDGTIYVCAGGATNTNGSGQDPCGVTADDAMNSEAIGIEAGNNGVGEPWPTVQQLAYTALCGVLCAAYGIPVTQVHGHAEYAPSRKIDPAGPSDYAQGAATWDMDAFRADLDPLPPEPVPVPSPPEEDTVKHYLISDPRTGAYYCTDMATFKTYVGTADAAAEGVRLFGWVGWDGGEGPIPVGVHWVQHIDTLPTTGG